MLLSHLPTLLDVVSIGLMAGICGFVYVTILTQPGQILSFWKTWLWNRYMSIFGRNEDKFHKYKWIMNPIVECELCVSGQIALWTLIFPVLLNILIPVFCICLSILIAKLLGRLTH